jgi:hypothetical protein
VQRVLLKPADKNDGGSLDVVGCSVNLQVQRTAPYIDHLVQIGVLVCACGANGTRMLRRTELEHGGLLSSFLQTARFNKKIAMFL